MIVSRGKLFKLTIALYDFISDCIFVHAVFRVFGGWELDGWSDFKQDYCDDPFSDAHTLACRWGQASLAAYILTVFKPLVAWMVVALVNDKNRTDFTELVPYVLHKDGVDTLNTAANLLEDVPFLVANGLLFRLRYHPDFSDTDDFELIRDLIPSVAVQIVSLIASVAGLGRLLFAMRSYFLGCCGGAPASSSSSSSQSSSSALAPQAFSRSELINTLLGSVVVALVFAVAGFSGLYTAPDD